MNTMMWDHPITSEHLFKLTSWGFVIIDPIEKTLMCGDTGKGAMDSVEKIAETLFLELSHKAKIKSTSLKIS
jgi:phosphopantothenoylcysteine decarboxylase